MIVFKNALREVDKMDKKFKNFIIASSINAEWIPGWFKSELIKFLANFLFAIDIYFGILMINERMTHDRKHQIFTSCKEN